MVVVKFLLDCYDSKIVVMNGCEIYFRDKWFWWVFDVLFKIFVFVMEILVV